MASSPATCAIAVVQCPLGEDCLANVTRVTEHIRQAARQGAQVVVTPELLEGPYFCQEEKARFFALAHPVEGHPTLAHFASLAYDLGVVLPISFFERAGPAYYNSVALFDADGRLMGTYRKSHIPDGPGYEEKFYFRPGDTGFRVWNTRFGAVGVGICWDQWYPECARALMLLGADVLLYPTAIGSEPQTALDTKDPWQRVMVGHAVANIVPVAAANRIGTEGSQTFYGSSFVANECGDKIAELDRTQEGIGLATFDFARIREDRAAWGFFRDRRTDLYDILLTGDGDTTR